MQFSTTGSSVEALRRHLLQTPDAGEPSARARASLDRKVLRGRLFMISPSADGAWFIWKDEHGHRHLITRENNEQWSQSCVDRFTRYMAHTFKAKLVDCCFHVL